MGELIAYSIESSICKGNTTFCWRLAIYDFRSGAVVKNLPTSAGNGRRRGSIPELERSPGVGNDNPFQYSYLEFPWTEEPGRWATVHGVAKSRI